MGRTPEQMGAVDGRAFGVFFYDPNDTSSPDNGGTVIVDGAGRRFRRNYSGPVDVRWFGAVGDGVTDDTAAIQAAVDASPSVRCVPGAAHVISAPIRIPSGVTFDASNSTILASSDFHMLTISNASDVHVVGGNFVGGGTVNAPADGTAAVHIVDSSRFSVSGIATSKTDIAVQLVNSAHGKIDGVTVEGGDSQKNGDGVTFSGCDGIQISRVTCRSLNKVAVYASIGSDRRQNRNIAISDVIVDGRPEAPFSCAVQIRACAGAVVTNVVARDTVYGALSIQQYDTDAPCVLQDIVCSGIVSSNSSRYGLFVSGAGLPGQARRMTFSNVRIESSATNAPQPGAVVDSVADVAIEGLSVTGTRHGCGLQLSSVSNAVVTGLRVADSSREGLLVTGCDGVLVSGVMVSESNASGAGYNDVLVTNSSHVVVDAYVCRSAAWTPIYIENTSTACVVGHGVASGHIHSVNPDNRALGAQ